MGGSFETVDQINPVMSILEQVKGGALADTKTLLGAIFYAIVFGLIAWLTGRALRLAVQRVLASDTHDRVDRTADHFLAQLARFGVYSIDVHSYAHQVPVHTDP